MTPKRSPRKAPLPSPIPQEKVEAEVYDISAIRLLDGNSNLGSERGDYLLETSIQRVGLGRGILLDKDNRTLGGNHVVEKAAQLGFNRVVVVDTDGETLVATRRKDLSADDPRGLEASLWDNRVPQENIRFDESMIIDWHQAGDLPIQLMWHQNELAQMRDRVEAAADALLGDSAKDEDGLDATNPDSDPNEERDGAISTADVPDAIWPTNNDYGIPLLDIHLQADLVDSPAVIWGSQRRTARMRGTWLFYTEDYRYTALWRDPTPVVNSGCVSAVEPNFSCYRNMPMAVALYRIYQKRWIARFWQNQGVRILVDLNVADPFYEVNLLGIPKGWRAWCTRGYADRMDYTLEEHRIACEHAGTDHLLFVVYGGGRDVGKLCGEKGWVWIREDMDRAKDGTKDRTDREEG